MTINIGLSFNHAHLTMLVKCSIIADLYNSTVELSDILLLIHCTINKTLILNEFCEQWWFLGGLWVKYYFFVMILKPVLRTFNICGKIFVWSCS